MLLKKILLIIIVLATSCSQETKTKNQVFSKEISKVSSDTLRIFFPSKKDSYMGYQDIYGNDYNLQSGENLIIPPIVLTDLTKQTWYVFSHGGDFDLQQDSSGSWIAHSKTAKNTDAINFHVAYRKQVEPFSPQIYMSPQSLYIDPTNLQDLKTRDQSIKNDLQKRFDFLKKYAQTKNITAQDQQELQQNLHYEVMALALYGITSQIKRFDSEYLDYLIANNNPKNLSDNNLKTINYKRFAAILSKIIAYHKTGNVRPDLSASYQLIDTTFVGQTKDYLLFSLLKNDELNTVKASKSDVDTYTKKFLTTCKTPAYNEYLQKNTHLSR